MPLKKAHAMTYFPSRACCMIDAAVRRMFDLRLLLFFPANFEISMRSGGQPNVRELRAKFCAGSAQFETD